MLCVDLDENNISFDTTREDYVIITCKQKHLGLVEQLRKIQNAKEIAESYVDVETKNADEILDLIRSRSGPDYPAQNSVDYILRNFE